MLLLPEAPLPASRLLQHDGLSVTSCHDCQEPCYKYPCQSGGACSKTFCHK